MQNTLRYVKRIFNQGCFHQGPVISPLLFFRVMDAISRDIKKATPWDLLYVDVFLAALTKQALENNVHRSKLRQSGLKLNNKTSRRNWDPREMVR